MRRSAAADSSEPSPSVGSAPGVPEVPEMRGGAGSGAPCAMLGCGKAVGLAASAATSTSFLKRFDEVKCFSLRVLTVLQTHMMAIQ